MTERYLSAFRPNGPDRIRWRRDVLPYQLLCEYTKEVWEPFEAFDMTKGGVPTTGLRLVTPTDEKHRFPLEWWERKAALNGWSEPGDFTYHDSLPDGSAGPAIVSPQAILQLLQDIDRHGLSDNSSQPAEDALDARIQAMIKALSSEYPESKGPHGQSSK